MLWFRSPPPSRTPLTPAAIREVLDDVLRPENFLTGPNTRLEWQQTPSEVVTWELFHGRLLDVPMTRQQRTFESWNVFLLGDEGRSAEPLLSAKLDAEAGELHLVRSVLCYAWETYSEGNVILSRETRRWVRELVGTVILERFETVEELTDELICLLFQAVVGTSRLPLTSVEAPLPAFSFGELLYLYKKETGTFLEMNDRERAKLLETHLHRTPADKLSDLASLFPQPLTDLRNLFNEVSLSPYTGLVDKAIAWLATLRQHHVVTAADAVDFLTGLLRLIGRHLTAFDLVTFHHRGANYPDALLLDALLKATFALARQHPDLFQGDGAARLRRRGVRQGWLLRTRYEGLPVPETPTSQGENLRVLPEPFRRVPDEQILQPLRRRRQLFDGDPLAGRLTAEDQGLVQQSLADLSHPEELAELGTALFLDRPLGAPKHPLEADATPLLSYVAYSRSLAGQRLQALGVTPTLNPPILSGLPVQSVSATPRPGTASLADALQVADDVILLRTTASSARRFWELMPPNSVPTVDLREVGLIVGSGQQGQAGITIAVYDRQMRSRMEVIADAAGGYVRRAGVECPAGGFRVTRAWREVTG